MSHREAVFKCLMIPKEDLYDSTVKIMMIH